MVVFKSIIRTDFLITLCFINVYSLLTTESPSPDRGSYFDSSPSEIDITLDSQKVAIGNYVEFVCQVKSMISMNLTWSKEGRRIINTKRIGIKHEKLIIQNVNPSDAGLYTCNVKTRHGSQNKTASLTVVVKGIGEDSDCGTPQRKLFTDCVHPNSFPNCTSFAPAISGADIHTNLEQETSRLSLKVEWKVPKAGNSDIWGWQIMVVDLKVGAGAQTCVQINKQYIQKLKDGDRSVFYTFRNIHYGTLIKLAVQSLPAMDMKLADKVVKTKDFCHFFPDTLCCHVVKNISIKQRDQSSVVVTWPDLGDPNNSKILTSYDIYYKSYPNYSCHSGSFRSNILNSINTTYVMINELKASCRNYTIKIRPVFNIAWCSVCTHVCNVFSKGGLYSESFKFRLKYIPTVRKEDLHPLNNLLKALVVVVSVFFLCVLIFAVVRHRKVVQRRKEEIETILNGNQVMEVFIAHSGHCVECKDLTVAMVTYLNLTGYCNCFVDLCSLPNEWSFGRTQYYENEIKKREKVIILCTVNEDIESDQGNPAVRNFIYQMNLIRSEILANCTTTKFIPVYMDFSSDRDLPCFLRNTKSFSMPSQLMELLLYIIEQPLNKPVSLSPVASLEENSNLLQQKKIIEAKIRELKNKHHKKKIITLL